MTDRLLPFKPTITPHRVDVAKCYDYGPSICGRRMWWCTGLGTDTIVSVPLAGHPGKNGKPWLIPNRLVADPCAINFGHLTLVLHTVGNLNGRGNGIGFAVWSDPTADPVRHGTLIPQTNPERYGIGQPAVAMRSDGECLLVCRVGGPNDENMLGAWMINMDWVGLGGAPILGKHVPFHAGEDGAAPEAWWTPSGKLALMLSGGGYCGVRTYSFDGATLFRDRHLERAAAVPGGFFWAQAPARATGTVDGLGIERDEHHRPIKVGDRIHFWQAQGDPSASGSWELRRRGYQLPNGVL